MNKFIQITGPSITEKEVNYVAKAARDGWLENHSKYINEFEGEFAKFIGVKYAIATSSCHGALHLALMALGIKQGDEIILPDITWIASASAIVFVGAKPVFVDINSDTWCVNPEKIEKAITPKTKAIMPVTLYGHPPEMDKIMEIARRHNLLVIEDAAQSVGSKYKGKRPGSFGNAGAFSFHGTKIMTTGEGGMFVTDNDEVYKRADFLANQGRDSKKMFWNLEIGLKYKMSNMQAALGTVQLSRIGELMEKKRQIFHWYKKNLGDIDGIQMNIEKEDVLNTYWMSTVILNSGKYDIKKEELMIKMKEHNIMTRPFFYPLSSMPPFKKNKVNNQISYKLSPYGINLPCGYNITKKDVDHVSSVLKKIINEKRY